MSEPILSARGLKKNYAFGKRTLEVLRGVDLEVVRGDFVALRGASGTGKSTLLHLIGGLDLPNAGEIFFAGQSLTRFSEGELTHFRNRRVGFVFQAYHLLPELDALENVCLPARVARIPAAQAEKRGRELLARVGLENRAGHKPSELSGGEQQRVAIARALVNEPELLLADEPTGNLDSKTGGEIIELLKSLRVEKQMTLIVATHDAKVAAHAQRVIELADGLIVGANEKTVENFSLELGFNFMLEDRDYMRQPAYHEPRVSFTVALLIVNAVVFVAQLIASNFPRGFLVEYNYFALSLEGLGHGYIWQLLTFQFMHAGWMHILFNSLAIFFFGRPVETVLGRSRFLALYLSGGIIGGVVQMLVARSAFQNFLAAMSSALRRALTVWSPRLPF